MTHNKTGPRMTRYTPAPDSVNSTGSSSSASPASDLPAAPLPRLLAIMARLRDPESGCPWDLAQDFKSIAPHTIEEAYEVAEAIAALDDHHPPRESQAGAGNSEPPDALKNELKGELGDLLFQVVYYARMGEERGWFDFAAIATAIGDKMIRRHPHIFDDAPMPADAEAQSRAWDTLKATETQKDDAGGAAGAVKSALDGVPGALPALTRAAKLQKRAAGCGFDWPAAAPVFAKIDEELAELRQAFAETTKEKTFNKNRVEAELGDLLFAVVNLARHLEIDGEAALRGTNGRFYRRFHFIENELAKAGKTPGEMDLDALDRLWAAAKKAGL